MTDLPVLHVENDDEVEFVGREYYLQELFKAFVTHKVLGIFGLKSVGKSTLATEFIKRICKNRSAINSKNETEIKVQNITADMHLLRDIASLHTFMCTSLGIEPKPNAAQTNEWKIQIQKEITKQDKVFYILFDNAEDVVESEEMGDAFLSLILVLIKHCKMIKIFITSTTSVRFAEYGRIFFDLELLPLPEMEATILLRNIAPAVDFGNEEEEIVKLSEGLPLLILMIGAEMKYRTVKPKEMVEMLAKFRLEALSRDCYPLKQRAEYVYRRFIERLTEIHQSRLAILGFIPGSFNTSEAKGMLDHETDAIAKHKSLIPIRRRHMLKYDWSTERFDIQGILRECLHVFFTIRNLPDVRNKYYKVFTEVMQQICQKLGTVEYTKALSEFSIEQPNLVKLLTEVFHSNEDNYHFFIEIATSCTSMIERLMSNVSDTFYQGCLTAAERYGRDLDKATVHIAIGSLTTNSKGRFPIAEDNYRQALRLLQPHGKSLQLATLYQRLGWNLHSQGKSFESLSYFDKALSISETSGKKYETISLQALSSLGIVNNWLGNYIQAEKCHLQVLSRRTKMLGENHPLLGETMNNIGLLYDQMGQPETALKYFEQGLALKKRNKGTVWSISFSLNNVANKYTILKRYDEAKNYLDESMNILKGMETPHQGAISLTYNSYGKMYRAKTDYEMASEMFGKAVKMRREIMPNSIACIWSAIQYAQVRKELNQHSKALRLLDDILENKDKPMKDMPHNNFVLECLQIKADIYKATGQIEKYNTTLWDIQSEMIRLGDEFTRSSKELELEKITEKLYELRLKLQRI